MDVEGGEVAECPLPLVLVLDAQHPSPPGRETQVAATPRLDGGLLVRRGHVLVVSEFGAIEDPLVETEKDALAFSAKRGSRGKIYER